MIDAANLRRCFEWKLLIAQNRQVSWLADLHLSGLLTALPQWHIRISSLLTVTSSLRLLPDSLFYTSSTGSKQIWQSASILQEIYTCLVHFLTKISISYSTVIGNPVFTNSLSFTFLSDYLSIGYSQSIPAGVLTGPSFATCKIIRNPPASGSLLMICHNRMLLRNLNPPDSSSTARNTRFATVNSAR